MARACDRCGRILGESAVRYVVVISITADVPAELEIDQAMEDVEAEIERLLERLGDISAEEAEAQVHQRMVYLLCPDCREAFAGDPIGKGVGFPSLVQ